MTPLVWVTQASAVQALWPTFGNNQICQLKPAKTESPLNVVLLLSAEIECTPKVLIYPHSAPKPKPKFGRPLVIVQLRDVWDPAELVMFPVLPKFGRPLVIVQLRDVWDPAELVMFPVQRDHLLWIFESYTKNRVFYIELTTK